MHTSKNKMLTKFSYNILHYVSATNIAYYIANWFEIGTHVFGLRPYILQLLSNTSDDIEQYRLHVILGWLLAETIVNCVFTCLFIFKTYLKRKYIAGEHLPCRIDYPHYRAIVKIAMYNLTFMMKASIMSTITEYNDTTNLASEKKIHVSHSAMIWFIFAYCYGVLSRFIILGLLMCKPTEVTVIKFPTGKVFRVIGDIIIEVKP